MYELYPYYTNDGTVGLFSKQDDDIYHSTHGALTESWQKFTIPSHLAQYINEHEQVKILDICYGIGYNTKTALQVFIQNALKQEKFLKKKNNFCKKNINNNLDLEYHIDPIDTDNILRSEIEKRFENNSKNGKISSNKYSNHYNYNEQIDTHNISGGIESNFKENLLALDDSCEINYIDAAKICNKILVDAVDLDKTLINLSPFIAEPSLMRILFQKDNIPNANTLKYEQIQNIKKFKKIIKNEYRLKQEVSMIILEKMIEANPDILNDKILQTILGHKKFKPYLSKNMINFARFYQNSACDSTWEGNKSTNLHNIYYQYLSKSYKYTQKLLNNYAINLNFYAKDARIFVQDTYNKYNFIFLDAFTPAKCPALWSVQFFRELYYKLEEDGMILTYSSSAAVRNALLQNGFAVGKIYDSVSKKFVGTVATKNRYLIEHELSEKDLDLINSRAGICFYDENLNLSNQQILELRQKEVEQSNLISSSKVLKGYNAKSL